MSENQNQEVFSFSNAQEEIRLPIIIDPKNETVWVTAEQMQILFDRKRITIWEHINNLYKEGELDKLATCRKNQQVQKEGDREVKREFDEYNLDVLISIGYRVKSKNGIIFRKWASQILKNYLLKGFALNESLLGKNAAQITILQQRIDDIQEQCFQVQKQTIQNFTDLLIAQYNKTFDLLYKYDADELNTDNLNEKIIYVITYQEAKQKIAELKQNETREKRISELFGNEKDTAFEGCLSSISQTIFGQLAYPTIEEQAAQLLYSILKNHCFSDGNKRIAACIFAYFIKKNNFDKYKNGQQKISSNALFALSLMVA